MTPETRFEHTLLNISKQEIRLLKLQPDLSSSGHVCGDIFIFELDAAPAYRALSYTWGPPTPCRDFCVNGTMLSVRENLWQFLDMFRAQPKSDTFLWTDQTCIDQSILAEKNHQVGLMGTIFNRAVEVIGWLGTCTTHYGPYFESVSRLLATHVRHAKLEFCKGPCGTCGAVSAKDPAFEELFRRPYWKRRWIIQELVLAHDVTFFLGSDQLNWRLLRDLPKIIRAFQQEQDSSPGVLSYELAKYAEPLLLNTTLGATGPLKLAHVIENFAGSDYGCSELLDNVYALLGMVRAKEKIKVDYRLPSDEVFGMVLESLLRHGPADRPIYNESQRYGNLESGLEFLAAKLTIPAEWRRFWKLSGGQNFICVVYELRESGLDTTDLSNQELSDIAREYFCDEINLRSEAKVRTWTKQVNLEHGKLQEDDSLTAQYGPANLDLSHGLFRKFYQYRYED